ncbi:MAG: right-handed parallel beta-helix repeat-containing protein [Planctomycetales bacterium]
MSLRSCCAITLVFAGMAALSGVACRAAELYVDNAWGRDGYSGRSPRPTGRLDGPVRTIQRAIDLAQRGDRIIVADTGVPYFESLSLTGDRHSGFEGAELTILGNGATVSGARLVPPAAWGYRGENLWSFTPFRKGHYLLLLDGRPVPEVAVPSDAPAPPDLPEGHWCAWRGTIHYRSGELEDPRERGFAFGYEGVGLSLYDVRHVVVRDLTFEHFRQDGVHAHDLCRDVSLIDVTSRENGRAGVAVGGTATVRVLGCRFAGNRLHDVLIREQGQAAIEESELEKPPTVID